MAHPLHHAQSSARKYGGKWEDYIAIHNWFDAGKAAEATFRHRALRHHSFGIFEAEQRFGLFITNSDGKDIPVRFIGEQHVLEDCGGRIPTVNDWLNSIVEEPWMYKASTNPVAKFRIVGTTDAKLTHDPDSTQTPQANAIVETKEPVTESCPSN